jgi:hypothetical protein
VEIDHAGGGRGEYNHGNNKDNYDHNNQQRETIGGGGWAEEENENKNNGAKKKYTAFEYRNNSFHIKFFVFCQS